MRKFTLNSAHHMLPPAGCQNTREWGTRFPESSGLNHNLADHFRENKKFNLIYFNLKYSWVIMTVSEVFMAFLCQYILNINCLWKFLSKIVLFISYFGFLLSRTVSITIISSRTQLATLTPWGGGRKRNKHFEPVLLCCGLHTSRKVANCKLHGTLAVVWHFQCIPIT